MAFSRLALLCALVAVAMCEECSPDAKKLTSLISNITSHVNEIMQGDQGSFKSFHDSALSSRNSLQDRIARTQAQLDSHRQSLARYSVQLTETRAALAQLELQQTEIQAANDNLILECERHEKLYQSRQKEYESRFKLFEMLRSFLLSMPKDGAEQDAVTSLLQALPALTANTHLEHMDKLKDVQTLLQSSLDSTGAPADETVQQLLDLLISLRSETEATVASDQQRSQARSQECSNEMADLRDRLALTVKKIKDATEKIQRLGVQIEDETSNVDVIASDVAILSHSFTSKQRILTNMEQAHQMRTQIRSSQLSHLTSLLATPACCMCPQ